MPSEKYPLWRSIFTIVSSTLGIGMGSMPSVIYMIGTYWTLVLLLFVAFLTFISTYFLSFASTIYQSMHGHGHDPSYESISSTFSSALRNVVRIAILFSAFSSVFTSIQKLMDIINLLFSKMNYFGLNPFLLRISTLAIISCAFYFLFVKDDLSVLSPLQIFSLLAGITFLGTLIIYAFTNPDWNSLVLYTPEKFNFTGAIGCCIFALECQTGFMDIYEKINDTGMSQMIIICLMSAFCSFLLYFSVAYFGFVGIGPKIQDLSVLKLFASPNSDVLISLNNRSHFLSFFPMITNLLFVPIFLASIAFSMFISINIVEKILFAKRNLIKESISRNFLAKIGCVIVFVFGICEMNVDFIISVLGYLLICPLSFLFPALFVYYICNKYNFIKCLSIFLIVVSSCLAIGLTGLEIYNAVLKLIW